MANVQDSWYVRTSSISLWGGKIITINSNPRFKPHTRRQLLMPDGTPFEVWDRAATMEANRKRVEAIRFKQQL